MRSLGVAAGVVLWAPSDAYFSYYNSPYIGHKNGAAVDIYPAHASWDGPGFSPVDGVVCRIKRMTMGRSRGFPSAEHDFGVGITPDGLEDKIVRILHCKPDLVVGDRVGRGDAIGAILRSRYFDYWTGPHYHVELMDEINFERPSQSYPIRTESLFIEEVDMSAGIDQEIECEVSEIIDDYMVVLSNSAFYASWNDLSGHLCTDQNQNALGIVDAGYPHYSHGGVIGFQKQHVKEGLVYFRGRELGVLDVEEGKSCSRFRTSSSTQVMVHDVPLRGISFFIYPKSHVSRGRVPLVLIPHQRGGFSNDFGCGDTFALNIVGTNTC